MTNIKQYLKRETTGLHTPDVTEIKNLAGYIDLLSSGEFTNYLFRENQPIMMKPSLLA
ncbi:hypothetical protein AAHB64_01720 [Bacillus toyonensis]